jgi:hypothetical protein
MVILYVNGNPKLAVLANLMLNAHLSLITVTLRKKYKKKFKKKARNL